MSDLISRQAVLDGIAEWIVNGYADSEADCSHISSLVTHLPSVENKGFDGMTNGEVIQALFPYVKTEDTSFDKLIGTDLDKSYVPLQRAWWNAPYKAEKEVSE